MTTTAHIIRLTAHAYHLPPCLITARTSRKQPLPEARQLTWLFIASLTPYNYAQIARRFHYNQSTVILGVQKVTHLLQIGDKQINKKFREIYTPLINTPNIQIHPTTTYKRRALFMTNRKIAKIKIQNNMTQILAHNAAKYAARTPTEPK